MSKLDTRSVNEPADVTMTTINLSDDESPMATPDLAGTGGTLTASDTNTSARPVYLRSYSGLTLNVARDEDLAEILKLYAPSETSVTAAPEYGVTEPAYEPAAAPKKTASRGKLKLTAPPLGIDEQDPSIADANVKRLRSKEDDLGLLSKLTFQWMWSLIRLGNTQPLNPEDIWLIPRARDTQNIMTRFSADFSSRRQKNQQNALFWSLHSTFIWDFWIGGIMLLFSSLMMVGAPYTLRYFLEYVAYSYYYHEAKVPTPPLRDGIGYVVGLTMMIFLQSMLSNHAAYRGTIVGNGARDILSMIISQQALTAPLTSAMGDPVTSPQISEQSQTQNECQIEKLSEGQIFSLFTSDTARIARVAPGLHAIWTGPIIIFVSTALLIVNIRYSALPGFGLLLLSVPGIGTMVMILLGKRKGLLKITDKRTTLLYEVLNAVRFIKLFGWEDAFFSRVEGMRNNEIRASTRLLAVRNVIAVISISLPIFAAMLSFVTYRLTGHPLDAASAFSSVALFNVLRLPLASLPTSIYQAIDAWAALRRIESYIGDFRQVPTPASKGLLESERERDSEISGPTLIMEKAVFQWSSQSTNATNEVGPKEQGDIVGANNANSSGIAFELIADSITLMRGELVAVIGTVGSGKSSLLAALTGEMPCSTGTVSWATPPSFCAQSAWCWNSSVRQNILFGQPMHEEWYAEVLTACSLTKDLIDLPNGDLTMIGEKGVTLSGGQKQRISLARAIYANRSCILLDDVLSALDARVANAVFEGAICGLLHDKLRVMVTNNLHLLPRCDRIIWVDDGRIRANGQFRYLIDHHPAFRDLVTAELRHSEVLKQEPADTQKPLIKSDSVKEEIALADVEVQSHEDIGRVIPWKVYYAYLTACGNPSYGIALLLLLIIAQGASTMTLLWLSWWVRGHFGLQLKTYVGAYVGLSFAQATLFYVFTFAMTGIALSSNKRLFDAALSNVLQAQMAFFDKTPLGHIIKRFSSDADEMDDELMDGLRLTLLSGAAMIAVWIIILVYLHWFGVALAVVLILWLFLTRAYRTAGRSIEQCEATYYSRTLSTFNQVLSGSQTIRTFAAGDMFQRILAQTLNDHTSASTLAFAAQKWYTIRLDLLGNALLGVTGALVLVNRLTTHPSSVGLVLALSLGISGNMQYVIKNFSALEKSMASVLRVQEYALELVPDEDKSAGVDDTPAEDWPRYGSISFRNVSMRYRPELPLVLRDFSLSIEAGERVGFVGRTGAGKTSIMNVLCRLYGYESGEVELDGHNISNVSLKILRSKLSIVPQDPTLLKGTVRTNLDPFLQHSDMELWSALRQTGLARTAMEQPRAAQSSSPNLERSGSDETIVNDAELHEKEAELDPAISDNGTDGRQFLRLDDPVSAGGTNFSVGQRQLLSLARAIVKDSRIVICDEVTASVDSSTDGQIQAMMQQAFAGKTMLCIAHRLRTILNYDRICVMDQGQVVEVGSPRDLFSNGMGAFRLLCEESHITAEDFLDV